jgi:DNA invertase Pin-like site-specific DNA recombinase
MHVVYRPSGDDSNEPDAGTPRVALYTSGYEPSSVDGQEAACRRCLAIHHPQWRVVAVYRDVAPTGGWRAIRPGLRHLLDAAASGTFDLLLVHRLDRLSRRMEHIGQIVEELDAASAAVRTVWEPFDSAAPANRLILRLWPRSPSTSATSTRNAETSNGPRPDTTVPPRRLDPARRRRIPPHVKRPPYRAPLPAVK